MINKANVSKAYVLGVVAGFFFKSLLFAGTEGGNIGPAMFVGIVVTLMFGLISLLGVDDD